MDIIANLFYKRITILRRIRVGCILLFAIFGATLAFLTTNMQFVRFYGRHFSFLSSRFGINCITRWPNPYKTGEGHDYIGDLYIIHLKDVDPGFKFIKNILQKSYYKKFEKDILLFIQYQQRHDKDLLTGDEDPTDPRRIYRPIYFIPKNEITQRLEFKENWREMIKFAKVISDENSLTNLLDDYFKMWILFWSSLCIVFSIMLQQIKI